jgi:hypothetical protein
MGQHAQVVMGLAERERAARELSAPQDECDARPVEAPRAQRERQPEDVTMARWLSAGLVSYWLTHAPRK